MTGDRSHKLCSLDDLRAAPYNPGEIDDDARRALGASMLKFGDLSGIT